MNSLSSSVLRRNTFVAALVAALVVALLGTLVPPPASAQPKTSPTPIAPAKGNKKSATAAKSEPEVTTPGLVRVLTPSQNSLTGRPLTIRVRTARGTTGFKAALDHGGDITARFHRFGRDRVAIITKAPAGQNYLRVSVRSGSKIGRVSVKITINGKQTRLITRLADHYGPLRYVTGAGTWPLALRLDPDATTTARLNGRVVDLGELGPRNVATRALSVRDGLRRGANVLVLQSFLQNGSYSTMRLTKTVPQDSLLVEAGPHATMRKDGAPLAMSAAASVPSRRGNRISYRWSVVQSTGGKATLDSASQTSTTLRAEAGHYLVRLTATERRPGKPALVSTDVTTNTTPAALPPRGGVFATMVTQNSTLGIRLDNGEPFPTFNAWDDWFGADSPGGIFALNPETLDKSGLTKATQVQPMGFGGVDVDLDINAYLARLTKGDIVVIVGQARCCALSKILPTGPAFTAIFTYDGNPLLEGARLPGAVNDLGFAFQLADGSSSVGGLSGFMRFDVAAGHYRFVRDAVADFSTNVVSASSLTPQGATNNTPAPKGATLATQDGAVYQIVSADANPRALTAPASGNAAVQGQPATSSPTQQWQMVKVYGDFYKVVNRASGLCLDLNTGDLVTIEQYTCDPNGPDQPNQLWTTALDASNTHSYLRSALAPSTAVTTGTDPTPSRKSMTLGSDNMVRFADDDPAHSLWNLRIAPGAYGITTPAGTALSEPGYGTDSGVQAVVSRVTGELPQKWQVQTGPNGDLMLQSFASHLCLGVVSEVNTDGGSVGGKKCATGDPTQWWTPNAGGLMTQTGLYLDTAGNNVVQSVQRQGDLTPLWQLAREPEPAVGGSYTMVDTAGRSLQQQRLQIQTATPSQTGYESVWTLKDAGSGMVQLVSQWTNCLGHAGPAVGPLFCGGQAANVNWRIVTSASTTGHVLASADGSTYLGESSTGTPTAVSDIADATSWTFLGGGVTFRLGDQRYSTSLPAGTSGFAVLGMDPNGQVLPGYPKSYVTNSRLALPTGATASTLTAQALVSDLSMPGATMLIQTIGRPNPTGTVWNDIASSFAKLGLSTSQLLSLDGSGDLAAAGCSGCPQGQPLFSEKAHRSSGGSVIGARLVGNLEYDSGTNLAASQASNQGVDSTLGQLLTRGPTPWPFTNSSDPAYAAYQQVMKDIQSKLAIPAAGTCLDTGGGTIRNNYCLNGSDGTVWTGRLSALQGDEYVTNGSYTSDQFTVVKNQLLIEWQNILDVDKMMTNVNTYYSLGTSGSSAVTAAGIAATIKASVTPVTDVPAEGGVVDLLESSLEVIGPLLAATDKTQAKTGQLGDGDLDNLTEAGLVIGLVKGVVAVGTDADDGSAAIRATIDTDALAYAEAIDAEQAATRARFQSVENLLTTDPIKLALAASNAVGSWDLTVQDQADAATLMADGVRRDLWLKLLPTAYELWEWAPYSGLGLDGLKTTDVACTIGDNNGRYWVYDSDIDQRALFVRSIEVDPSGGFNLGAQAPQALTRVGTQDVWNQHARTPSAALVSQLFGSDVGLAQQELPDLLPTPRTWPAGFVSNSALHQCYYHNHTTGKITYFDQI